MFDNHRDEEGGDIHELMQRYQNLKLGRTNSYIEEDDFERIIEHLDEKDEIGKLLKRPILPSINIPLLLY